MHTLKITESACKALEIDFRKVPSLTDLLKSRQVHFYGTSGSMRVVAEIEEETKLNLQVQVSSLKSLTTTHTDKIQELQFALAVRESLIEQEHQKNKMIYAQNVELQKKLDIAAKETEVKEA